MTHHHPLAGVPTFFINDGARDNCGNVTTTHQREGVCKFFSFSFILVIFKQKTTHMKTRTDTALTGARFERLHTNESIHMLLDMDEAEKRRDSHEDQPHMSELFERFYGTPCIANGTESQVLIIINTQKTNQQKYSITYSSRAHKAVAIGIRSPYPSILGCGEVQEADDDE